MSRRRKNSDDEATRLIAIPLTDDLRARHSCAAEKIIDILLEHCDGPADALWVLKCIVDSMQSKYDVRNVTGFRTQTEKIQ